MLYYHAFVAMVCAVCAAAVAVLAITFHIGPNYIGIHPVIAVILLVVLIGIGYRAANRLTDLEEQEYA